MKHLFLSALLSIICFTGFSQTYTMNSTNNGTTVVTCSGKVVDDGGGKLGDYASNSNYSITFQSSDGGPLRFKINFLNIESGYDFLRIYDGPTTTSPLLGQETGFCEATNDCPTMYYTSTSNTLTIQFTSDASINYQTFGFYGGFEAFVSCEPKGCNGNDAASDFCDTPVSICSFDGYCGNTSQWYTIDEQYTDTYFGNSQFCGTIENNSWVSFVPDETTVTIDVDVTNCFEAIGIQLVLFEGPCNNLKRIGSNCWNQLLEGSHSLTFTGLTVGATYRIMIDGYAGDICDYSISAISGIEGVKIQDDLGNEDAGDVCESECRTYSIAYSQVPTSFNWYSVPAGFAATTATINVCPTEDMTLYCEVTGACGASKIVSFDINFNASPSITLPSGAEICVDETFYLSPNSGGTWTSSNTAVATVTNTGELVGVSDGNTTLTFTDATTGCSNTNAAGSIIVNPRPIITLPTGAEICVGETFNLSPNSGGTWNSSDPTIATVDNAGLLTGISDGTVSVTFTDGTTGCSNTNAAGSIIVNPRPIITLPTGAEICVGETFNLSPNSGGTWASSDPTKATVDNTGLLTGVSGGTVSVTFTDGTTGCSNTNAAGSIIVNPRPIITLPTGAEICVGETFNLSPNSGGTWNSSDPTIATVDNAGLLTGISDGTVSVTFTDGTTGCSNTNAAGSIIVNPRPIITLPTGAEICVGETFNLSPNSGGTWNSSDPTIATVDNAGLLTGISDGTVSVTFTDGTTGCSNTNAAGSIIVNPRPIITLPTGAEICVGETFNLSPNSGGTWASSDPTKATVDNTGLLTGVSDGTVSVTFTDGTTGCSNTNAAGSIIVNPRPIITLPTGAEICVGETFNLSPNSG